MMFRFWTCGFVAISLEGSMLYKTHRFKQKSNFNSLLWEVNMKTVLRRKPTLLFFWPPSFNYQVVTLKVGFPLSSVSPVLPSPARGEAIALGERPECLPRQGFSSTQIKTWAANNVWQIMVRAFIFSSRVQARWQGHNWISGEEGFLSYCRH